MVGYINAEIRAPSGTTDDFFDRLHNDVVGARHLGRVRRSNEAARAMLLATEDARRGVWLTLVSPSLRLAVHAVEKAPKNRPVAEEPSGGV